MAGLFNALTAGFSRFVLAWLVPSVTNLSVFCLILYPDLVDKGGAVESSPSEGASVLDRILIFAFLALLLALVFALGSLPLYRILEGYLWPAWIRRKMVYRQARHQRILRLRLKALPHAMEIERGLLREKLANFPNGEASLLPTRLGNAFRSLETYGIDRFQLDSQTLWYELQAVAPDRLQRETEDARASVDFFIAFVGQLVLLVVVSLSVSLVESSPSAFLLATLCLLLSRVAYGAAVRNMGEYRAAVQALVNVGRLPLCESLGYRPGVTMESERTLWREWSGFVSGDRDSLSSIDQMRAANVARREERSAAADS